MRISLPKSVSFALTAPLFAALLGISECQVSDADGDGYTTEQGDCDDADETIYPGAYETCDGIDRNCNAVDDDEDGFLRDDGCDSVTYPYNSWGNPSYGLPAWDCDDAHSTVYPGAPYTEDAFDYDCDGVVGCAEGGC